MSEKQSSDLVWQMMHWHQSKETPLCFSALLSWDLGIHTLSILFPLFVGFVFSHRK